MTKLLLTADETAQLIGFSRSKTYAMLKSGELPSLKVGRTRRVPAAALEEWVRDQAARQERAKRRAD